VEGTAWTRIEEEWARPMGVVALEASRAIEGQMAEGCIINREFKGASSTEVMHSIYCVATSIRM